ncbi:unnamed protein product [Discosporangium mesarthrocarpum]
MILVIQVLTGLFVLLSLSLIVTVPVSLAIPGQWELRKTDIYKSTTLWSTLIILIAFSNSFAK